MSAASSISQLLIFNALKRGRKDSTATRHSFDRGTVLPLYLGLLIHSKTRKREHIDNLFRHGLSVSYDRVLQFTTNEANRLISIYENEGLVCPSVLRNELFTTANLDIIDYNPTSTSSQKSFHGKTLSISQHPTQYCSGNERKIQEPPTCDRSKSIRKLPDSYGIVQPVAFPVNLILPLFAGLSMPDSSTIEKGKCQQN